MDGVLMESKQRTGRGKESEESHSVGVVLVLENAFCSLIGNLQKKNFVLSMGVEANAGYLGNGKEWNFHWICEPSNWLYPGIKRKTADAYFSQGSYPIW